MAKKIAVKPKVVVFVDGGNVQAVYAPKGSISKLCIVDFDNLRAMGKNGAERDAILTQAKEGLAEFLTMGGN